MSFEGGWLGALACAVLAGCGSSGGDTPPATGSVRLTLVDQHHTAAGVVDRPVAPVDNGLRLMLQLDDGSFQGLVYTAAGGLDGVWQFDFLNPGRRFIVDGKQIVDSAEPEIDLGHDRLGRPDAIPGAVSLIINGSGLLPWTESDRMWIAVPNLNSWHYISEASALPALGATDADQIFEPWNDWLISGSDGDELYVMQSRGDFVTAMHVDPFDMADQGGTSVTGTFVPPYRVHLQASVDRAGFSRMVHLGHPALSPAISDTRVLAGAYGATSDLWYPTQIYEQYGFDTNPVLDADLADPFPLEWPRVVSLEAFSFPDYRLPDTSDSLLFGYGHSELWLQLGDVQGQTLEPIVSPPLAPHIAGVVANGGALDGVPNQVDLAWVAPETGAVAGYTVELYQLSASGSYTYDELIVNITTTETHVPLVPAWLHAGNTYYAVITAYAGDNLDLASHPYRRPLPWGSASALTRPFTVR